MISRAKANEKGGIKMKQKFPQKVIVWLGFCSKVVALLVIFDQETTDYAKYIQNILPIALKYENKTFGEYLTFQ